MSNRTLDIYQFPRTEFRMTIFRCKCGVLKSDHGTAKKCDKFEAVTRITYGHIYREIHERVIGIEPEPELLYWGVYDRGRRRGFISWVGPMTRAEMNDGHSTHRYITRSTPP